MSAALDRLATLAAAYRDPVAAVDWGQADASKPWLPPDCLNLAALGEGADDAELVRRFSRVEFARLCATGLWLEGIFISQLTRHGLGKTSAPEARVILGEVREEAGHSLMFLEAIERAGMAGVDLLGGTDLLTWIALRLDPAKTSFWAMAFIGEAVTDALALRALKHADAICPATRQILLLHHRDEARHIAAARAMIEERRPAMGVFARHSFPPVMRVLVRLFADAIFYPTPQSLKVLGLANSDQAARAARACSRRRAFVDSCLQPALETLARAGLIGAGRDRSH